MNINSNPSQSVSFNAVRISAKTKKIMEARGEYEELKSFMPELERKGKCADIELYAAGSKRQGFPSMVYGMSIRPLNRLLDNGVTKFLGLSKNRTGDSFIVVNDGRATDKVFRDLYNEAFQDRRLKVM